MPLKPMLRPARSSLWVPFLVPLGIWTLVVGAFLAVLMYYATVEEREIARNQATESYLKDLAYQRWAAELGGMYTPATGSAGRVHEPAKNANGLRSHLTSLRPIRPENAPDPWERKALEAFERGTREFSEEVRQDGKPVLRFLGAYIVEPSCLPCHARQGYKVGEVRGGISIVVPLGTGPAAAGFSHEAISVMIVLAFWMMGGAAILVWVRRRGKSAAERRQLMAELQKISQRFEAIQATTPDSLWLLDRQGHLQWVNDTYCQLSGYSRDELIGQSISLVAATGSPGDTSRDSSMNIQDGLGMEPRFRTQVRAKDGRPIDLEVTTSPLTSKGEIVAFLRDITQEVQAARQLRESEARFRLLFECSPAPMYIRHAERLVQANQAMAQLMEAESTGEMLNLAAADIVHPDFHKMVAERIQTALASKRPNPPLEEIFITRRGNQVPVEVRAVALDLPDGPALLVFAMDLTELRRSEADRRKLEAEVQHAQKLESLGSLAGGIAHDMNNVLAAILGMSSVLQAKANSNEALARSLQIIEKAAIRGRDLVKGLMDFARKGLQEARVMDLNALLREELDLLVRTSRQRFVFEVQLEEGLPSIMGEPSTLGSAFMNLCVNAFDAMPRGGTLRVRTHRQGTRVVLVVADTGQGIPAEILSRVTEPFFTTKPPGRGTGLGLAMVYGTMKAHGGTLDIQSEVGKGTCISLNFPAAETVAPSAPPSAPSPRAPESRLRILIIDDDALIRGTLPAMLEQLGHWVDTAPSGLEGIRRLDAGLQVDLVILDHNMPGLSGGETIPRILQRHPERRVLVATGFMDNDLRLLLAGFPTVHVIQKPFTLSELRQMLQDMPGAVGSGSELSDSS
jgi:two-component system cell cycle sensor histidine kinase/response regulator CckA